MWPTRSALTAELHEGLQQFSLSNQTLLGMAPPSHSDTLVLQMIASLRRLDYTQAIKSREVAPNRADPKSSYFEPERAAAFYARRGQIDEAIWLIFLATHFGQHGRHGWRMLRDVYSGLGSGVWTWARVSSNPVQFTAWLKQNAKNIKGAFGNHRKYETLSPTSHAGTANVIQSFVNCFAPSPSAWFAQLGRASNDPHRVFDAAYSQMNVERFGRLAKFDFLALLGRLDLAPIEPGSAYLSGATGPLRGARLLIDGDPNSKTRAAALDKILQDLDRVLGVGMQVMEDSLCNWQKSPSKFVHFKG
jgi:hypothetical protein